jgi:DMSO/TMAO reductase YedYZ heme-binding membrane subunit
LSESQSLNALRRNFLLPLALLVSAAICARLADVDLRLAAGAEVMVLHSVRCALPFFLVAFTASSIAVLWPGRVSRWVLRNRRSFGLAFAVGMAWHLGFVAYFMIGFHKHLNRVALTTDFIGLAFLVALTTTSFPRIARHLPPGWWRRLHKTGVYAIWLLASYIYLLNVHYSKDAIHVTALGVLILAWCLRAAAWLRTLRAPLRPPSRHAIEAPRPPTA